MNNRTDYIKKEECKNLVFGGGGIFGYTYVGAIDALFTDNMLKNVTNFVGTSVGAIVATILACGGDKQYLYGKIRSLDASAIQDNSSVCLMNLYNLFANFGYNKGTVLLETITQIVEELTGDRNMTFKKLYKMKKVNLVITGVNISRGRLCYFHRLSYPKMKIADAVRISSSVPLFFEPFQMNGELYVDGGLISNYPIDFVTTDMFRLLNNYDPMIVGAVSSGKKVTYEIAQKNLYDIEYEDQIDHQLNDFVLERTIGMKTHTTRTLRYIDPSRGENDVKKFGIISFCNELLYVMNDTNLKLHINDKYWSRTVKIDVGNESALNFDLSVADKKKLILKGFTAGIEFNTTHSDESVSGSESPEMNNLKKDSEFDTIIDNCDKHQLVRIHTVALPQHLDNFFSENSKSKNDKDGKE
jgi:NTE family protein